MISSIVAFVVAVLVVLSLTPVVRRWALTVGAVDGTGGRRVNERPIPRLGGIAVTAGFFLPLLVIYLADTSVATLFFASYDAIVGLAAGGTIMCLVGVWDDIRGVRALHKLGAQLLVAGVAYSTGFRIEGVSLPMLPTVELGLWSPVLTTVWIVAVINAVNLIDGLDGLAAGVTFFVCATNFVVGALNGNPLVMVTSASLGGAAFGFLFFNFNPASIFMGDSGSLFVGYILATTSMMGASIKSSTTVAILAPLIALGLPIMDTLLAIVRRLLQRKSIFSADRGHIHHLLLALGLTHRRAVMLLYGMCVFLACGAISISIMRDRETGVPLLVACMVGIGIISAAGVLQQSVARWRKQELGWSPVVEAFRTTVPDALFRLRAASDSSDVVHALTALAESPPMRGITLEGSTERRFASLEQIGDADWAGNNQAFASVSFPFVTAGEAARLKFLLRVENVGEGNHPDVLLQLVADACEAALQRVGLASTYDSTDDDEAHAAQVSVGRGTSAAPETRDEEAEADSVPPTGVRVRAS